jgi:sugar/nucleoside kinase (ribokinase family)
MSSPRVLCVGSLCLDTIVRLGAGGAPSPGELVRDIQIQEAVGGCCGNAAFALSRMDATVAVAARTGADAPGNVMRGALSDADIQLLVPPCSGRTSRCVVVSDPATDDRTFYYEPGVNEDLCAGDVAGIKLNDFDAVLVTDPFLTHLGNVELRDFLCRAHADGVFVALDLCWDPSGRWAETLEGCYELLDLLLAGADEAAHTTGFTNPQEAARAFTRAGARSAIVKAGADGLFASSDQGDRHRSAAPVEVVDPTGAGDWCAAGAVIGSLTGGFDLALETGALAGAAALTSVGGSTAQPSQVLTDLLEQRRREAPR